MTTSNNGKIRRLRNLPQNRGKSDAELRQQQAQTDDATAEPADLAILSKFHDAEEKRVARKLHKQYTSEFSIDNVSDRNNLAQVIYLEVTQLRIQEKLNEMYAKDAKAIPTELLEVMNKNSEALIKLKNTLGLSKSREQLSTYDAVQHLMSRHAKWRAQNQASRHIKCPHCLQFIWLKIRTEAWEAQRHPFFQDTFVYNKALFDHFGQQVTIDRDFLAAVFGTSPDYADWLIQKIRPTTGDTNGEEKTSRETQEGEIINGRTDTALDTGTTDTA